MIHKKILSLLAASLTLSASAFATEVSTIGKPFVKHERIVSPIDMNIKEIPACPQTTRFYSHSGVKDPYVKVTKDHNGSVTKTSLSAESVFIGVESTLYLCIKDGKEINILNEINFTHKE